MNRALNTYATIALLGTIYLLGSLVYGAERADPFSTIRHFKLANGLNVVLAPAPGAELVEVQVAVDVGWVGENSSNWGISHLLEHVLFRHPDLPENMSYLELIKEAGGEANGSTTRRQTNYFASVPKAKAKWLVEAFNKMLLNNSVHKESLEKEKGTVLLEIGDPSPLSRWLGFDVLRVIKPRYLELPDFWKREFGVTLTDPFTINEERLSTIKISTEKVTKYYQDYYYPGNMTLFIAGGFDFTLLEKIIKSSWGKNEERLGKKIPAVPKTQPRSAPYKKIQVADQRAHISMGTKVWDIELEDNYVLRSYMNSLAHRLMKEVRHKKGQTYGVEENIELEKRFGYAAINLTVPFKNYKENLQLVEGYIEKEARQGQFDDRKKEEAVDLFVSEYELADLSASTLMSFAQDYEYIRKIYGRVDSPPKVLRSITSKEYNSRLQKMFAKDRAYSLMYRPPYLFPYEAFLGVAIVLFLSIIFARQVIRRPFQHDAIRWVRKIKYLPLKSVELVFLLIGAFILLHLDFALEWMVIKLPMIQQYPLVSSYAVLAMEVFLGVLVVNALYCRLPRKLMVVENCLVIKSVNYFSFSIPLDRVIRVAAIGPFSGSFNLMLLLQILFGYRAFYLLWPWKKGLLIETSGGQKYFYGISEAEKGAQELSRLIASNVNHY